MKKIFFAAFLAVGCMLAGNTHAQVGHGGEPLFNHSQAKVQSDPVLMPFLDSQKFIEEDMSRVKGSGPMRIGIQHNCDIDVLENAKVVKDNRGTHYLLSLSSEGATFQSLNFDRFELPEGASLFIYDRSGDFVLGSFDGTDVLKDGGFITQAVPGDELFIEYNVPAGSEQGKLHISQLCHGYKDIFHKISSVYDDAESLMKGYHGSAEGSCHINAVCPEGDDWRDQIRSVVAIQINTQYAAFMCSGALVNNTRQDKTPYVLSAYHCQEESSETGSITNFVFYFGYQTNSCNGTSGPYNRSVSGADRVAKYNYNTGSDFCLFRLSRDVPNSFQPYYAGWDRSDVASFSPGIAIHHPGGDYKKLSFPKSIVRGNGSMAKFLIVSWYTGSQNKGTTEEGSSGSPIFNSDKRIVGQLFAGYSSCTNPSGDDYYGRVYSSWTGNNTQTGSLQPWLDPDNTGVTTLDGLDYNQVGIDVNGEPSYQSLKVYPNPSDGNIRFDVDAMGDANYKVYDVTGRCVKEGRTILTSTTQAVDLRMLPQGTYVLHLYTSSQRYSSTIIIK